MFNLNNGQNNFNNISAQNRVSNNLNTSLNGRRKTIKEIKEDMMNASLSAEREKIRLRNEREKQEELKNNPKVNLNTNNTSSQDRVNSLNNLRRGNFY